MKIEGDGKGVTQYIDQLKRAITDTDIKDTKSLTNLLLTLREVQLSGYEPEVKELFSECLKIYLDAVISDDFDFNRSYCYNHSEYGILITNVAYSCDMGNVDYYIEKAKGQKQSLYKRLLLTSSRSDISEIIDLGKHYAEDIPLFNNWVCNCYQSASSGFIDRRVVDNLIYISELMMKYDFMWGASLVDLFNCVTYMDNPREKDVRSYISSQLQKVFASQKKESRTKTGKIAIYSENWFKGHSTHRTIAKYFRDLFDEYEFILLYGERYSKVSEDRIIEQGFKQKHKISVFGVFDPLEMSIVGPGNLEFDAIIYPDAGFDAMSLILANMRIAPVQIGMTGFPISIFGGELDYFVSGSDVECLEMADENYDERLVCLPGLGAVHERPDFIADFKVPAAKDEILVGGSWIGPKTHYYMLDMFSEIFKNVNKKCKFRIFPAMSWFHGNKSYQPYVKAFGDYFDESLELQVIDGSEVNEYLRLLSEVDCALDSYPWGGSNTCSDCLHLNKPVIMREGTRWYNRIGPAMLRSIGLEGLVANTNVEYIDKSIRIIEDDAWRIELTNRIFEMNNNGVIDSKIYNCEDGVRAFTNFVRDAIDGKIQSGKEPILINSRDFGNEYNYYKKKSGLA